MGPHCTVRPRVLTVAYGVTLTLEPIKSHYIVQYLQCGWSSCVMVSLSHLQRQCHWIFVGRVQEYYLWMGSLWHFGRKMYETV